MQPSSSSSSSSSSFRPLVVCGPSGVGKGTLLSRLFSAFPSVFGKKVSHTTRPPRSGEIDGIHYYFVNRATMEEEIKQGLFIEYAYVHQHIYGTSISAVQRISDSGRVCVLEVDIQGAEAILKTQLNPYYVFIFPPSFNVLQERLQGRGSETDESINVRLNTAKKELEFAEKRKDIFTFTLINDDLDQCYQQFITQLEQCYPQIKGLNK